MTDNAKKELMRKACEARKMAYAPYSRYMVGAALLAADGRIFTGCNVENAAYGPCNCAERTAFFKAVSEGVREFTAIAVTGGMEGAKELDDCTPCGVCRQVMAEFCSPETFAIIMGKSEDGLRTRTLGELLPEGFGPGNLGK